MLQSLKNTCLLLMIMVSAGCQTLGGVAVQSDGHHAPPPSSKYKKQGPPPHAPAHGYRHKHQDGYELEYDSKIGAYIVVNVPDTYFANDLYLRMSTDGRWMVAATLDGGRWRVALASEIPPKMRHSRHKVKHKKYDDD